MGTFEPPSWAFMVPVKDGTVPADDPQRAGTLHIYKIRPNQIDAFNEKFAIAGWTWIPIFSLQDVSGNAQLPAPVDPRAKMKKDPRAY